MEIDNHIFVGDSREVLKAFPDAIVNTTVTSPPYYNLRDYGEENQIGLEESLDDYIEQLCIVFDEVHRVTKDDGTFWLNIGDCYANKGEIPSDGRKGFSRTSGMGIADKTIEGLTTKDLIGVPWRVAFALQKRGWILRSDIIWAKKNPIPESIKDRPTSSHEHIFLFSKQPKYYYDFESVKEKITNLENNGGYEAGFDNEQYKKSGAKIADKAGDIFNDSDIIVKVKEPLSSEIKMIKEDQIVFTYLHLAAAKELTEGLINSKSIWVYFPLFGIIPLKYFFTLFK